LVVVVVAAANQQRLHPVDLAEVELDIVLEALLLETERQVLLGKVTLVETLALVLLITRAQVVAALEALVDLHQVRLQMPGMVDRVH
jgi:hypothetical protein